MPDINEEERVSHIWILPEQNFGKISMHKLSFQHLLSATHLEIIISIMLNIYIILISYIYTHADQQILSIFMHIPVKHCNYIVDFLLHLVKYCGS